MQTTKMVILTATFIWCQNSFSQNLATAKKHLYNERYETAKKILLSDISKGNADPENCYWLSEIYLSQNKLDSAKQILEKGAAYAQQNDINGKKEVMLEAGLYHLLLDEGKAQEAKSKIDEALKLTKNKDPELLLAVANANIDSKNGNLTWALELLNLAQKRDKKNPRIYSAKGDVYRKTLDGGNAVLNYKKSIEVEPDFAEAFYKEGKLYKTQKNPGIYIPKFVQAYTIDSTYVPALRELYYYYFTHDIVKAEDYLNRYIHNDEPKIDHAYMRADVYYLSKRYHKAIDEANEILQKEKDSTQPRLYKLIAYSYAGLEDSSKALGFMNQYFEKQDTADYVAKDFDLEARLLEKTDPDKSKAIEWYRKAYHAETDKNEKLAYMIKLAQLQNEEGNPAKEAMWRERIYVSKPSPSNMDIYKWGIALFTAEKYKKSDSVFAIYEKKYPDQIYGYLWRAKSNALIDTTMQEGLAVPHYEKLIEVAEKDQEKNKSILISAYGYLGAYDANIVKDYSASLKQFDKILQLEPDNKDAQRYKDILEKRISNPPSGSK
jgi:lipopolysaccharide biosynthesis regulator YciM